MRGARGLVVLAAALGACHHSHNAVSGDGGADLSSGGADSGFTLGTAITAADQTWTWVPFSDALCANGAATGLAVNLSSKSSRVLIYLEGGGACWNALTCYTLMTAANFTTGYGESDFTAESTDASYLAEPGGFFDRTAAANPFKDYSYVYVPYCTGDIFAGNNVAQYGSMSAMHVGFKNVTAYLQRLVPTFPSADRVYLAGSSAGGFGAVYNWWQAQKAFGAVRVDVIDDSGTFMPADITALGNGAGPTQAVSWNLAATLPPGCTGCSSGLDALYPYYAAAFPNQDLALLSYAQDSTLPSFDGITEAQFQTGLGEITSKDFDPNPGLRYFEAAGPGHVLFFNPTLSTKTITLQSWLWKQMC